MKIDLDTNSVSDSSSVNLNISCFYHLDSAAGQNETFEDVAIFLTVDHPILRLESKSAGDEMKCSQLSEVSRVDRGDGNSNTFLVANVKCQSGQPTPFKFHIMS